MAQRQESLPPARDQALARDLVRQLVETNSAFSHRTLAAARAVVQPLTDAGFAAADIQV